MKKILILMVFSCCLSAIAQKSSFLPTTFTNKKTNKHVHVPGTRFSMIPPEGFHTIVGNTSLKKSKNFEFEFQELKSPRYLKTVYESYGFKVVDSINTSFDVYQAVVYEFQSSGYQICMLSFWDSTFTGCVTLTCPPSDSGSYESTKKAFTTVYFNASIKADPFEIANFKIDDSKSEFKYSEYNSGMFTYTPGGIILKKAPSTTHPEINIFIQEKDTSMSSNAWVERAKLVLADRGMKIISATKLPTTKINQYEAAEMEVYGRQNFMSYKTYLGVIQDEKNVILILGLIPVDHDANMVKIKDFVRLITLGVKKVK